MKPTLDVTNEKVFKDGRFFYKLTYWKKGLFDHVDYVPCEWFK